ncbi:TPA: hypothetical protein N0F65_003632 [Lagenidium giganteum]|uniref:SH2 domain-containing protein n=1 Tax=Lagenidium giganteum TaxID=4803 RepID=A0AAV2YME3_9STRA|nr:TPA: hypothetical protein N0F65_003632 [Lagenidium giganteum]
MVATAILAHLHSSPLVVRRRSGSEWRSLSSSHHRAATNAPPVTRSGLEPVEIIDVKQERRLLLQCLREAKRQIVWHSEVADLHTFRKVLSYGCRALHFSGHGVPGKVIFENAKCEEQFVAQQELRDLLLAGGHAHAAAPDALHNNVSALAHDLQWLGTSDGHAGCSSPLQLVVVSACHSESVAEAFVSAGVPHVVVVSSEDKVLDKKAMEFSKAFYTALFAGHSVAHAFQIGRVQADLSIAHEATHSRFKLLGHGDHEHDLLFADVAEGSFVEHSLPPTRNECDAVAEVFVGRSLEVHQVYKSLVEGARLVSVTGERGIGKTEVALQCAQYAAERHLFKHIFYLRLEVADTSALGADSNSADPAAEATALLTKFKRCFHVDGATDEDLADEIRQRCLEGTFLLILDGCNRATRRNASFRAMVTLLLRRVSSLSLLLTGDGKIGGMDGVGEKIVTVERLPPADAALLFTLRAPRKLKAHEMGSSSDLAAFAEHPIVRSLCGHPRTICAVAQFLETKDMEIDQREFLQYIIPSVNAGLGAGKYDQDAGFVPMQQLVAGEEPPLIESAPTSTPHLLQHHRLTSQFAASSADLTKQLRSAEMARKPTLESSHSESDLTGSAIAMKTSQRQLCALTIADHAKRYVRDSVGSLVWAHAVVAEANIPDGNYTSSVIQSLVASRSVPIEQLAPQLSRYFATALKREAVKRPLSLRSIDFLSKSALVWGGRSPAQRQGNVDLEMFAAFWNWFNPLTDCIRHSRLWAYTQPRLVHGFLSKASCINMLQSAPAGTFLLRFSETRKRCFVIAFVDSADHVQFVPITCIEHSGWHVALQDASRNGVTFASIPELIQSVSVLKFLFPQTPKEVAFQQVL